jgi:hypothetical protein
MRTIAGWCAWFRESIEPCAQVEGRCRALAECSQPLLEELIGAAESGAPLEGLLYALALLVEQHVSLQEDDPMLIATMQKLFYELPNCFPELNRSFFKLEIYPVMSIMMIYG